MSVDNVNSLDWSGLEDFLGWIYGAENTGQVWTTGFADIGSASWHGRAGLGHLKDRGIDPAAADLYFCIGLMREGETRRSIGGVSRQPLLIVDDIGTKVDAAKWDTLFALGFPLPSFRIETSPGNQTWGWVLDGDDRTPERWAQLSLIRAWFVEKGLTDNVMDEARYIRLPAGWNSKPKYREEGGEPPAVGLVGAVRRERVALDDIGRALLGRTDWADAPMPASGMTGAALSAAIGAGALRRTADMNNPDPLILLAQELGMNPVQIRTGVVEARCPNIAAHSDRAETGFAFLGDGLAQCQHASCQHLRSTDFRAMMVDEYNGMMAARAATGMDTDGLPTSAIEFLARADFQRHGVKFDANAVAIAEDEAAALAARSAQREQLRALEQEAAIQKLVQRFVWVVNANCFFDLEERSMLAADQFDKHPDILAAGFKAGHTGLKRASNVLLNRPDLQSASDLTYKPGVAAALVMDNNASGVRVQCANTWVGTNIGQRAERPSAWLDLVEHVLHDKGYREWYLDWLAYKLQNRAARMSTVPTIVGGQGVGKDVMMIPIVEILGPHNVQKVSTNMLESDFNEWMQSEFVMLPELKLDNGGRVYNKLKDWTGTANQRVKINPKYQRGYSVAMSCSFHATSNHLNALQGMEADDRRFSVFMTNAKPKRPEWYSAKVAALYDRAEIERVHHFLMTRDLKHFNPQSLAPENGAKAIMMAENLTKPARWVYDECQEGGIFHGREFLTLKEVEDTVQSSGNRSVAQQMNSRAIRDGLVAAQFTQLGRVRAGQDRAHLWLSNTMTPERKAEIEAMTGADQLRTAQKEREAILGIGVAPDKAA